MVLFLSQGQLLQDEGVTVVILLVDGVDSNNQQLMSKVASKVITLHSFDEAVAKFDATLNVSTEISNQIICNLI